MSLILVNRVAQLIQHVKPEISEADLMLIDVLGHVPTTSSFMFRENEDFEKDPKIWCNFFAYLACDRVPLMTIIRAVGAAAELCPGNHCGLLVGVKKFVCENDLGITTPGMDYGTGVCLGLFLGANLIDNYGTNRKNDEEFLGNMLNVIRDICTSHLPGCRSFQNPSQQGAAVNVIPAWVSFRLDSRKSGPRDNELRSRRRDVAELLCGWLMEKMPKDLNSLGYMVLEMINRTLYRLKNDIADTAAGVALIAEGAANDEAA